MQFPFAYGRTRSWHEAAPEASQRVDDLIANEYSPLKRCAADGMGSSAMDVFSFLREEEFEEVRWIYSGSSGLFGAIVIHDTTRGPAFGGIRLWKYPSETALLEDAMRLARAMTYKCALADIPGGGGKIVLDAGAVHDRRRAFEDLARIVASYRGRFLAGPDMGVTADDLAAMRVEIRQLADCVPDIEHFCSAAATVRGLVHAARAGLFMRNRNKSLRGIRFAIQGLGEIGWAFAKSLLAEGARVIGADLDRVRSERAKGELGIEICDPAEILEASVDVLSPCAFGGVIDERTAERILARVVVGSANNVLASREAGMILQQRGIVFVPDILASAGAVIQGAAWLLEGQPDADSAVDQIYGRTVEILGEAQRTGKPPDQVAEERAKGLLRRPKSVRDWTWESKLKE